MAWYVVFFYVLIMSETIYKLYKTT